MTHPKADPLPQDPDGAKLTGEATVFIPKGERGFGIKIDDTVKKGKVCVDRDTPPRMHGGVPNMHGGIPNMHGGVPSMHGEYQACILLSCYPLFSLSLSASGVDGGRCVL